MAHGARPVIPDLRRVALAGLMGLGACGGGGAVVQAPVGAAAGAPAASAAPAPSASDATTRAAEPSTCASRWSLEMVGGGAQAVVMCPGDVRRAALDPKGPLAGALSPGLEPARERVCGCAERMHAPPFVDLVLTAKLDEGRVTVEAKGDDDELDPELGPPFVACVGTVTATFSPRHGPPCGSGTATSAVYPVRIEIGP
jgi:hypothetical protein